VQAQILNLLKSLQAEDVCVMLKGRIVERGSTALVLGNPQHDYTKTLLAAVPKITG